MPVCLSDLVMWDVGQRPSRENKGTTLSCLGEGWKGESGLSPRHTSMAQHALPDAERTVVTLNPAPVLSQEILSASLLVVSGQTHSTGLLTYPFMLNLHTCTFRMCWGWRLLHSANLSEDQIHRVVCLKNTAGI